MQTSRIISFIVRNPCKVLKMINTYNIRALLRTLNKQGLNQTLSRVSSIIGQETSEIIEDDTYNHLGDIELLPIYIPTSNHPTVSIVIPVYNNIKYTYLCIKSIVDSAPKTPFEIIIGDDCSTDETLDAEHIFKNAIVIHNSENLRFTLNCNNASKFAKGSYILFLNNDTIVHENWLDSLVDFIDTDPTIGLIGSKFLWPNGKVQEAGGIIWNDGSGWNYGRNSLPLDPGCNYVKDCDYITGASMMIRTDLWKEIGGFDERFAPSYCEDSDLAFEVRKHGKRVVYQPESKITHFEGMSNGRDPSAGIKKYMVVNQGKLYKKWKNVLEQENFDYGEDMFHARDRTSGKKTVLVIDWRIPHLDNDAGSRNADNYLRVLLSLGLNVKFLSLDYKYDPKYTRLYQQMGIEVLYGMDNPLSADDWIKVNGKYIDYSIVFRPECASRFLRRLRKHSPARIVYNTCDLHYVRLRKQYEITGSNEALECSKKIETLEMWVMSECDAILSLNNAETDIINARIPGNKAHTIPGYYFDSEGYGPRDRCETHDILFVGGFSHTPNIDGVHWFVDEILPKVKNSVPDCVFHVVGSNPPEDIVNLTSTDVIVHGYVCDQELDDLYRTCSVCVIPLRFGAGVKGKTVEAMYKKIPTVSTSIGLEGLPGIEKCTSAFNDSDSFATEVVRLLENVEEGELCAKQCAEYVRIHFSMENMRRVMSAVLFDQKPDA